MERPHYISLMLKQQYLLHLTTSFYLHCRNKLCKMWDLRKFNISFKKNLDVILPILFFIFVLSIPWWMPKYVPDIQMDMLATVVSPVLTTIGVLTAYRTLKKKYLITLKPLYERMQIGKRTETSYEAYYSYNNNGLSVITTLSNITGRVLLSKIVNLCCSSSI